MGTHDLFHDEDLAYAERLTRAGVACHVEVVPARSTASTCWCQSPSVAKLFRQPMRVFAASVHRDGLTAANASFPAITVAATMSASSSANTVCGETLSTHRSRDVPARQRAVGRLVGSTQEHRQCCSRRYTFARVENVSTGGGRCTAARMAPTDRRGRTAYGGQRHRDAARNSDATRTAGRAPPRAPQPGIHRRARRRSWVGSPR
ncbi:amidohydrolase 3 domain protein [Mycobacterium xenopi 4042]|uniref:Amidohydrolase 3 domain protein n=1 Tax=Mycobacterium xenopi 4042 TaxID=1299334 RepID=X8BLK7_MYCXE|nr:amidohydrolase 3 domain protein [Mycobacterium xenopi 4042]